MNASTATMLTSLFSLCLLSPAMAIDFSGNLKGITITDSQASNIPPVATFNYSISGETVTFDASDSTDSDGNIIEYIWDYGDGTSGIGQNVTHSYASYGEFPITLAVIDNGNAVSIVQKKIIYGAPIQLIGTSTAGTTTMSNSPNHAYFHKLSGTVLSNGKLSKYRVTIAAASSTTRAINLGLYSHDIVNNKPFEFITGSDCGWTNYKQDSGETFECIPLGNVTLVAGQQYWVGVRGIDYGGIRGDSSGGTYYGYYLGDGSSWVNIEKLTTQTTNIGTAGILQIEVTQ